MIILLTMALQVFSNVPTIVPASPDCSNISQVVYKIERRIVCVPSDGIFKGSFER